MYTFRASSARKKTIQPGLGRNDGRRGAVGDEPRGAGGGVAPSRLLPRGGIALRYSSDAFHTAPAPAERDVASRPVRVTFVRSCDGRASGRDGHVPLHGRGGVDAPPARAG